MDLVTKLSGSTARFLLALFVLCFAAFAGERQYVVPIGPCLHRGTAVHPIDSALISDFDPAEYQETARNCCYKLKIPKWDGLDNQGQFIGFRNLNQVEVDVDLNPLVQGGLENTSATPITGYAQADAGCFAFCSQRPFWQTNPWDLLPDEPSPLAFGGNSTWYIANASFLDAFDGDVDGYGTSGRTFNLVGNPPAEAIVCNVYGWDPASVRPWTQDNGELDGLHEFYFEPRIAASSSGMPSHWRYWVRYSPGVTPVAIVRVKWTDPAA